MSDECHGALDLPTESLDFTHGFSWTLQEINADINGALNIARKELGDEWLKKQLKANGGRMNRPVSVRDIGQTLKEGLRFLETASVRAR